MTLYLLPHRENLFKEILDRIPTIQKRIVIDNWHQILGEICSVVLALPCALGLFNNMQEALRHMEGKMVALNRCIHLALEDFRWIAEDLSKRPTRLYELGPLQPTLNGYQDVSGYMCGWEVLPGTTAVPWTHQPQPSAAATSLVPAGAHIIVWRGHFTTNITAQLVSWSNPEGQVTNSDLELADSVLHHVCMSNCFGIYKHTTMSCTNNTAGL